MTGPIHYSIDTSALIHWWVEDYSPDVFPGLVPKMESLIEDGRLRAIRAVKDELGEGDLRKWCTGQTDFSSRKTKRYKIALHRLWLRIKILRKLEASTRQIHS